MIFTAQKLISMCEIAIRSGFANCDRLRSINAGNGHMVGRARLTAGDQVIVPPRQERVERGPTGTLHTFQLDQEFLPRIEFIREDGHGYGRNNPPMDAAEQQKRGGNFRPEMDPVINELNLTNYVANRGGTNAVTNNFPRDDAAGFAFVQVGSDDPDHFKVQVIAPRIPAARTEVEVTLIALKPHYFKKTVNGKDFVEHAPRFYTRPADAPAGGIPRRVTVKCRRIGKTDFFRSPYLRLVPTDSDRTARPNQFLLVSDYFDEPGAPNHEKFYIEILHQKVEAEALLAACKRTGPEHCGVYKIVDVNPGQALHIAIHGVNDGSSTLAEMREAVFRWTRRVYAPAQCRPVLDLAELRPAPTNILSIANLDAATAGRHASGKTKPDAKGKRADSQMTFTVDGNAVTVPLRAGNSPLLTSIAITNAINSVPALAGFTVATHAAQRENFTPVRNQRSTPTDIIIMRPPPAGGGPPQPANVRGATSNDAPIGKIGGQTLESISSLVDGSNNFPAGFPVGNGSLQQRALRSTYFTPDCINVYLMGANAITAKGISGTFDGWSPWGSFTPGGKIKANITAVGPSVFMRCASAASGGSSSIRRPLVLPHEIGHPLFHVVHTKPPTPLKDAPPAAATGARSVEIMDPAGLDNVDAVDMCRHIADRPIKVGYDLLELLPNTTVLDGTTAPARSTPVDRLHQVGSRFNIIRGDTVVPFDGAAPTLPNNPPQHVPRRPPTSPGVIPPAPDQPDIV